jgi:hypothetical protein
MDLELDFLLLRCSAVVELWDEVLSGNYVEMTAACWDRTFAIEYVAHENLVAAFESWDALSRIE